MSLRSLILVSALICLSFPLEVQAEPQDMKALQGKWQATEATSNGEPPPTGMLKKLSIVFTNDMVSIMGAPLTRFTIDTNSTPARIDILNSRHQVGIYELKGDTLKLCVGLDGDRPKAFSTKKIYRPHLYFAQTSEGVMRDVLQRANQNGAPGRRYRLSLCVTGFTTSLASAGMRWQGRR